MVLVVLHTFGVLVGHHGTRKAAERGMEKPLRMRLAPASSLGGTGTSVSRQAFFASEVKVWARHLAPLHMYIYIYMYVYVYIPIYACTYYMYICICV